MLVILPMLTVGAAAIFVGLPTAYVHLKGISLSAIPTLNALLLCLPAFLLWIPITLLLTNCVLFAVTPLRRVAEEFVLRAERPGFVESQRQLGRAALIMAIFCLSLIVLGFLL